MTSIAVMFAGVIALATLSVSAFLGVSLFWMFASYLAAGYGTLAMISAYIYFTKTDL
ncbi:hypothetical protein [Celeribacter baekdonensis]|uniref:hypothetical protein n=1 Tax=Celeribacter baekdonensis TaxID=875171 RepID=UPI00131F33B0|nr:hypothetical protein [Celeribacter baekdonensis]